MENNGQPKMDPHQYRAICDMITHNDEESKKLIKDVKIVLSEKIDIHMGYIKGSYDKVDQTLTEHNSRLKKVEIENERRKGAEEVLTTLLAQTKEDIKELKDGLNAQVKFCGVQKMKTEDLEALEKWVKWVKNNPFKFIAIAIPTISAFLLGANALWHLIEKG